jgi:APA family basic amino acid/polyamine antiporter
MSSREANVTAPHLTSGAPASPTEGRPYGYWAGHCVVMASMIGAGILTTSGFTLKDTGNPAALLALWALGGVLALCGAVTVAELATTLPRAGGDYVFVGAAYGRGAAFVSGWATFVVGFAAPTAVVAHLSLTYLTSPFLTPLARRTGWLPEQVENLLVPGGATALILTVALVHTLGARPSTALQVTATLLKVGILLALAAGGLLFGSGSWSHLAAGHRPTAAEWQPLSIGLIYVGYAYSGWNGAAYLAGEIREPARLLPRCLVGGTASVVVLYLLVNLAYVYALDPGTMQERGYREVEKVAELATDALFGRGAANAVAVALGLSLFASVSAYVLAGPRVAFAMARGGAFPGYAGQLHRTRGTPARAIWTQAALATVLVWSGTFRELLNYTSVGLAAVSGLTVASVFPLRRRADLPHPYRMPLYPLPPLLFLLLTAWTVGQTVFQELFQDGKWHRPGPATLGLLTLLAGIPLSYLIPAPKPADQQRGGRRGNG